MALLNPRDQLYPHASAMERNLRATRLVTTEFVLAELVNYFAHRGPVLRAAAAALAGHILQDREIEVVRSNREWFERGLAPYGRRKSYRISMATMQEREMVEVLTQDRHFQREGFVLLLESHR